MKSYLIIFLFSGILTSGFKPFTNPLYITGHIKKDLKDSSTYVDHLMVFVKGRSKILAKAFTDNKGNFEMTFTPEKDKSFDFYCSGIGIDTLLLASITTFESDTPTLIFYIPGHPKRNAGGKVICLKCKRTDKVFKIEYSDSPVAARHINNNGDTSYNPIYKGRYLANRITGPAKYFCDRDKLKF